MVMINIYLVCKQFDNALDEMELLLSQNIEFTANDFKIGKEYDPLRDNPRFKALMEKYRFDGK